MTREVTEEDSKACAINICQQFTDARPSTHILSPFLFVDDWVSSDVALEDDVSALPDFLRVQEVGQSDADLWQV